MDKNEFNDLLDKYLKGVATEKERQLLDDFFDSFDENEEKQFFLKTKKDSLKEEMWAGIHDNFQKFRDSRAPMRIVAGEKKVSWTYRIAVAASLILVMVSAFLIFNPDEKYKPEPVAIAEVVKSTPKGQKKTLRLSDGTVVKLNSNSRLTFSEKFTGNERRVVLEGEAWFEVTKDPEKPFIVETQHLDTKVLGTSFNISSFPEEEVTVTLVEGKVQIDQAGSQVMLDPNEQLTFDPGTKALNKKTIDPKMYIAWKDGILHFEESSLSEIIPVLENWYGVTFEYNKKKHGDLIVSSGTWDNQSLEQVLKSISFMINNKLAFDIKDKHVVVRNDNL